MWLLRVLLSPFALLYWLVTRLRNHLFDIGYSKSFDFDRLIVSVGNLSVGGTGKTPMIEYLVRLIQQEHSVATLSRGYRRKSRGFKIAGPNDSADSLGDEPYQLYLKFKPEVTVAVGEERALGISSLLLDQPEIEVVLLDDAFQHRTVRPQLNILLTSFAKPFYQDHILPMGRLREAREGASRAEVIVVTKCSDDISATTMHRMCEAIFYYAPKARIFFSRIKYASPKPVIGDSNIKWSDQVILVSGIAASASLEEYVSQQFRLIKHLKYRDHHHYSAQDLMRIKDVYNQVGITPLCILTTEKDMVKWLDSQLQKIIQLLPVFYLPIEMEFVEDGEKFDQVVLNSFDIEGDNGS